MSAISGTWKAQQGQYVPYDAESPNWGNGINPVHGVIDSTGRNIAPEESTIYVSEVLLDDWEESTQDIAVGIPAGEATLYGYGAQTGTSDRPGWDPDSNAAEPRATTKRFPRWGGRRNGLPGGILIRSLNHGATITDAAKATPTEDVAQGWTNKDHYSKPEDAVTADDSQLYMQTSMTQRDKVRDGSQAARGRANEVRSSIASRIPGQRVIHFSGGHRHYDMTPREQATRIRPFWIRSAGTGDPADMTVNAMYVSQPRIRVPSARPDQGAPIDQQYDSLSYDETHGYVPEDMSW